MRGKSRAIDGAQAPGEPLFRKRGRTRRMSIIREGANRLRYLGGGTRGDAGGVRRAACFAKEELASSGAGSERAKVASAAEGTPRPPEIRF